MKNRSSWRLLLPSILIKLPNANHTVLVEVKELLKELTSEKRTSAEQSQKRWDNSHRPNGDNNNYNNGGGRRQDSKDCYYLGNNSHFVGDCSVRREHIEKGMVKAVEGKLVFYDGKNIPFEPRNKTRAQKVEEYYRNRYVSQNFTAKDGSCQPNYKDDDDDPMYDIRADEIRSLQVENNQLKQQMLQKQTSGPVQGDNSKAPPAMIDQLALLINQNWDHNNQQFVATRQSGNNGAETQDF
ncbi:hypothetical protein B0H11DRAFT_1944175 [Mycena galericulata]|nr:hypothetical protein B0H11DRAFT_1944175 [Mycena galericulata]